MDFFELEDAKDKCRLRRVKVNIPLSNVKRAVSIAKRRNIKESRFGAMTYGGKLSGIKAHVIGILAEEAVACHFGQAISDEIFLDRGDNGVDILDVPGFGVVGVKCTTYQEDPYLRVEKEHFNDSVDTYILCYVNPDLVKMEFWLVGWASKLEVQCAKQKSFRIKTGGRGPLNYVLEEHELHGFDCCNF